MKIIKSILKRIISSYKYARSQSVYSDIIDKESSLNDADLKDCIDYLKVCFDNRRASIRVPIKRDKWEEKDCSVYTAPPPVRIFKGQEIGTCQTFLLGRDVRLGKKYKVVAANDCQIGFPYRSHLTIRCKLIEEDV